MVRYGVTRHVMLFLFNVGKPSMWVDSVTAEVWREKEVDQKLQDDFVNICICEFVGGGFVF